MRRLWQELLSIFLKERCPLCQRLTHHEVCDYCARRLEACQLLPAQQYFPGTPPLVTWGNYQSDLKRALAALKYEDQPRVARLLGRWLAEAWVASSLGKAAARCSLQRKLVVVPIPLHAAKQRQRGYNQADLLAESFCQIARLPLHREALERVRATEAQFGLSKVDRDRNLEQAFQVKPNFARKRNRIILLLDDIYTTGATVRSAKQAFSQQGISVYGVVAVAKTLRH